MSDPHRFDFESLFEALPDGIAYTDMDGRVERVNGAFLRLFGLTREAILGRSIAVLFADPEEFHEAPAFWDSTPARASSPPEEAQFQCRLRTREGRVFRAELVARLVYREVGTAVGCIYVRDIEAQCRAQDALLEVSDRLKTLVAASPLAIMLLDVDGVTHMWNPAAERVFGYRPDEVVGRFLPTVPDDRRQEFLDGLSRTRRGDSLSGEEAVRRRRDGTLFTVAQWTAPIKISDGTTRCLMLVADLSQRKQMEEELEAHAAALSREARVKDDFLAVLSHELRNPLSPLVSAASLLREHTDGSERSRRTLDVVDRQLRKLQRLVDDLLDVSRIRSDKLEIKREVVPVVDVVEESVQTVRPIAESKHQTLEVVAAPDLWVLGDPFRLEQVFGNLLHNAVKYTDAGGRIDVHAERDGDSIVVRVRDSGIGISAEARETLFKPFAQAERSRHLSEGGLGLGLALVRALVALHDGVVSARSEGPGHGSEFEVRLAATEAPEAAQVSRTSSVPPQSEVRRRVLLVDDNEDAVSMMAELIVHWGHTAVGVLDGEAALAVAQRESFDVAFVDIEMPGMSGYELAERLRELPNGGAARLVALTGHGADADRKRSAEAGFAHHLVKPIDATLLLSVLSAPTKSDIQPRRRR